MDLSFNIPHAVLKELFKKYEIKTDLIQQAATTSVKWLSVEHAVQSVNKPKYIIGWVFADHYTVLETVNADYGVCWAALVEGLDIASNKGKCLVPSQQYDLIQNYTDPYQNPIVITHPAGYFIDSLGVIHYQGMADSYKKFNVERLVESGKKVHFVYQNDAAAVNLFSYLIWAEGDLK